MIGVAAAQRTASSRWPGKMGEGVRAGEAVSLYEKQRGTRGRPEALCRSFFSLLLTLAFVFKGKMLVASSLIS